MRWITIHLLFELNHRIAGFVSGREHRCLVCAHIRKTRPLGDQFAAVTIVTDDQTALQAYMANTRRVHLHLSVAQDDDDSE